MKTRIKNLLEPIKSKKGVVILTAMLLVALAVQGLVACSDGTDIKIDYPNSIQPLALTEDQKDVLDMTGNNNDINIFQYKVDDSFKTLEIIREIYKNGEYFSGGTMSTGIDAGEGMVSIVFDSKTGSMTLSNKQGGAITSSNSMLEDEVQNFGYSSGKTWLQEETEIKDNEDVILMVTVYEDANGMSIYTPEYYAENPGSLNQYDYAQIIKCRFLTKDMSGLEQDAQVNATQSDWISVTDEDIQTFIERSGKPDAPEKIEKLYDGNIAVVAWLHEDSFEYYELYKNMDGEVLERRIAGYGSNREGQPFQLDGGTASGDYPHAVIQCMDDEIIKEYEKMVVTGERGEYICRDEGQKLFIAQTREIGEVKSIAAYDEQGLILEYDFAQQAATIPDDKKD